MAVSASDQEGSAAQRRSRRQMLAGGAAGALGMFGLEAMAPQAQAADGDRARPSLPGAAAAVVTKVKAGDDSIKVGGTASVPTIKTGTLDGIAALHPAAEDVTFNGHKGINVANGSAPTDIAAYGQLPSASSPLSLSDGGTGLSESSPEGLLAGLGAVPVAGVGQPDGVASLDSAGQLPKAQVPQLKDYAPTGLPGATAASRYVGATAGGAPTAGTFAVGDFIIDQSAAVWVCTTAGSPGSWTQIGGGASPLTPQVGISIATLPGIWAAMSATQVPARELLLTLATATQTVTLTQMAVWIGAAGAGPDTGVNGLAIYSAAGALLGRTADMTSDFELDNNYAQEDLTAGVPVVAGTNYYLAYLHNFTGTPPAVPGFVPPPGAVPAINGHVLHGYVSDQDSFPASFDPSALLDGEHWYWVTGSA